MKNKPELLVLIVALLAMAAKLYCAFTTFGTVDFLLYYSFAKYIATEGVIAMYTKLSWYNHPPLIGNYLGLAYGMAGGDAQLFAFLHRLPGIMADLAVVLLVLRVRLRVGGPPIWAVALLAASPVSFMISGYHGNYDSLIPLGLFLPVLACMRGRVLLSGVLLAVACQVKIIPLMMSPVFFFFWWHRERGKAWTFAVATVVTLLLCWAAPLLTVPHLFLRQVVAYNSIWGWWGITYLLNITGIPCFTGIMSLKPLTPQEMVVTQVLKLTVVAGTLVVAWCRRKGSAEELLATVGLVWGLFFTFAPGFGVQYLVWVGPFLLFYSPRWFAAFTASASVALFIFYDTISGGIPWQKGYGLERLFSIWGPWMLLPWVVFLAFIIVSRREFGIGARPVADSQSTTPQTEPLPAEVSSS